MSKQNPFPNQGEIIRYLAGAFDLKASKKKVDEYARHGDMDYRLRGQLIEEVFTQPLRKILNDTTAYTISAELNVVLDDYIEQVNTFSVECVTRENALSILYMAFIGPNIISSLNTYLQPFGLSASNLVKSNQTSIDIVLNWFDENLSQWNDFYNSLEKEHKDRLVIWRKNKELPQLNSIKLLPSWLPGFEFDSKAAHTIKALLLVARVLDWIRKDQIIVADANTSYKSKFGIHFNEHQAHWFNGWAPRVEKLFKRLSLSKTKNSAEQQYTREILNKLTQELAKEAPGERVAYNISWLEARWQLLSGELKTSVKHYKRAFELCLYTAGTEQQRLFKEACVVAAKAKDRAFMKKLKNQAVTFGWLDAPSKVKQDNVNNNKSRSKDNIVEDWEVDRWIDGFNKMLPQSCMFTGCVINRAKDRVGPQHSTFEEAEKYKPDFRNLDRIIKTGSWNRQMPQLVWFIYQNKLNYVQQLLEKGASVNVTSESGETPILMAIQHMDVTSTPFKDPEDRFFNLVAAYEHEPEIINMRTSKKKLLALICAVETGKPQIVSKVLELGAEIDRRGQFEENTALYFCVALVSRVVKPAKIKAIVANLNANPTNMLLDSLQRTEKWGTTLDDTDRILQAQNNDEVFQEIETVVEKLYHEREQLLNPAELRKIAIILLNAGANPNATHFFDYLRGYTPLMFAAENDEVEIFEKMLECDGDPLKTFYSPQDDCQYHCFHVAFKWKSEKVLKILQQKYPRDFDSSMAQISAWRDNLVVRSNSQNSNLTK